MMGPDKPVIPGQWLFRASKHSSAGNMHNLSATDQVGDRCVRTCSTVICTDVFNICMSLEVIVSCSVVHAVHAVDRPLWLTQLGQVLNFDFLCLGRQRGQIGGNN